MAQDVSANYRLNLWNLSTTILLDNVPVGGGGGLKKILMSPRRGRGHTKLIKHLENEEGNNSSPHTF